MALRNMSSVTSRETKNPNQRPVALRVFACLFLAAACIAGYSIFSPSLAGFEWVPPPHNTIPEAMPLQNRNPENKPLNNTGPTAPPASSVVKQLLGSAPQRAHQPAPLLPPSGQNAPIPLGSTQSNQASHAPAAQSQSAQSEYEVIAGFGSDLPIAFALSQIVPADYSYSFGDGVNPGLRVSWNGGKPWDQVVSEMVAPLNLAAQVNGQSVLIYDPAKTTPAPRRMPAQNFANAPIPVAPSSAIDAAAAGNDIMISRRQNIGAPEPMLGEQPQQTIQRMKQYNQTGGGQGVLTPMPGDSAMPPVVNARQNVDPYAPAPMPKSPEEAHGSSYASAHSLPKPSWGEGKSLDEYPQAGLSPHQAKPMTWEAQRGDSMRDTLEFWARQANVKLLWRSRYDYVVEYAILINDTFLNALKLISTGGIRSANKPLLRLVDSNKDKQADLLIVQDRDTGM